MLPQEPADPKKQKQVDDQKSPSADLLAQRLRDSVRRRRPRRTLLFVFTILVLGVAAGGTLWWIWPEPQGPPLLVIGFDQIEMIQNFKELWK